MSRSKQRGPLLNGALDVCWSSRFPISRPVVINGRGASKSFIGVAQSPSNTHAEPSSTAGTERDSSGHVASITVGRAPRLDVLVCDGQCRFPSHVQRRQRLRHHTEMYVLRDVFLWVERKYRRHRAIWPATCASVLVWILDRACPHARDGDSGGDIRPRI